MERAVNLYMPATNDAASRVQDGGLETSLLEASFLSRYHKTRRWS